MNVIFAWNNMNKKLLNVYNVIINVVLIVYLNYNLLNVLNVDDLIKYI